MAHSKWAPPKTSARQSQYLEAAAVGGVMQVRDDLDITG